MPPDLNRPVLGSFTRAELLLIATSLHAVSRAGNRSPPYRLACKIEELYEVEPAQEAILQMQYHAHVEITRAARGPD